MRNNPYNKNIKDPMPLFMQGPRSINALVSNEEQKKFVEKAMITTKKGYEVKGVPFTMISPPVLNQNLTLNHLDIVKVEMGQTEVAQELFQAVMGWNDSENKSNPRNPAENVTWYDCIAFCNKLSTLLGLEECYRILNIKEVDLHITKAEITYDESKKGFRLPMEAEWEIFATASTNNRWSGTNKEEDLDLYAWYNRNSNYETHPVGEKLPNEWGLYDMTGNVWEWCWNSDEHTSHIVRGGSYRNYADGCRVIIRIRGTSDYRSGLRGFRLCRSLG